MVVWGLFSPRASATTDDVGRSEYINIRNAISTKHQYTPVHACSERGCICENGCVCYICFAISPPKEKNLIHISEEPLIRHIGGKCKKYINDRRSLLENECSDFGWCLLIAQVIGFTSIRHRSDTFGSH